MSTPFTWKDRVDVAIAAAEARRSPKYGNTKLEVSFRTPASSLIRDAALARGVTVSGFVRRASLAMTAQVLALAYQDLITADPTIQLVGAFAPAPDPGGRIGGPWEIVALR